MPDPVFRLGTFAHAGARPFVGLVLGDQVTDVAALHGAYADSSFARAGRLAAGGSMLELLGDWTRSFAVLQAMTAFLGSEGTASERVRPAVRRLDALRVLPPVLRPGKMLYAAANYKEHVAEMRASKFTGGDFDKSKDAQGDKARLRAYLFLKAPSCLAGAFDDIVLPAGEHRIDWEAELAVVIGRPGRNVPAERALDHVAGFMTTNDVSCRDLTWREDRPTIRSDWLAGKSFDTFAPTGPFLVPREFVPNHDGLRVWLAVNGATKQDGNTGDMIFGTAEQIEYASRMLTLEPGDLFATGTPSGVGQGRGEFLKAGDVVECEVEGLGRQRNRVVQGDAAYSS
jgi:2-keto-4-pentenoate hydratase/2-oxohepta-3-ene-1,7-dioic acid hydratase in catechol pathway